MTQLTTKTTKKCIQLIDGGEIWVEEKIADMIARELDQKDKVIKLNGQIFKNHQITGIKSEEYMKELNLRKNGYWKCDYGTWHTKGETCCCGMSYKHNEIKEDKPKEEGERLTGPEKWGNTLPKHLQDKILKSIDDGDIQVIN